MISNLIWTGFLDMTYNVRMSKLRTTNNLIKIWYLHLWKNNSQQHTLAWKNMQ